MGLRAISLQGCHYERRVRARERALSLSKVICRTAERGSKADPSRARDDKRSKNVTTSVRASIAFLKGLANTGPESPLYPTSTSARNR